MVNANLSNANIATGAAILASKLDLSTVGQAVTINGNLTLTGAANDFSAATISDLGTVTTADINGGTIDGTTIGASSASTAVFTDCSSTFYSLPETTAPTTAASEGALYTKDTSGQPELFYREESNGGEIQITSAGLINAQSLSNVIFIWNGGESLFYVGSDGDETSTVNSAMMKRGGVSTTYVDVFRTKYTKKSGADTLTGYAYVNVSSTTNSSKAGFLVDINSGALTGSAEQSVTSVTREWITTGSIDVSSLSDDTTYDLLIQLRKSPAITAAQEANLHAVIIIAS